MKNMIPIVLMTVLVFGCSKQQSETSKQTATFSITSENVLTLMPSYFEAVRSAIASNSSIPKIEGSFFASDGLTFSSEAAKTAATPDEIQNYSVSVFDPTKLVGGSGAGGSKGVITFERILDGTKCCFLCNQFGMPGICSNCRASECKIGAGWLCGEQPNSCDANICNLPGLTKVNCVY